MLRSNRVKQLSLRAVQERLRRAPAKSEFHWQRLHERPAGVRAVQEVSTEPSLREGRFGGAQGIFNTSTFGVFSPLSSLREEQDVAVVSRGSAVSTQGSLRAWITRILLQSLDFLQLFASPAWPSLPALCSSQARATIPELLNQRSHHGQNKTGINFNCFLCCLLWKGPQIKTSAGVGGK